RLMGLSMEITERKRAEEAKAKLAAIVESSDDAIISKTLGGVILTWNRGAERIFGYAAEDVIGRSILLLIPRELQDEEKQILQSICRGEHVDHYETVRIARDGRRIDVSLTVSPIKDAAGQIVGASKIARDITERKRAQEALKEAYGSLQAFFNHRIGGIGIVRATVEGDIVQANDYYLKMVGRTLAELEAGQVRWVELTAPEWHVATEKALAQVRKSGVCDTYEKEYVRRDGTRVPVLMTYARLPEPKGEVVAFVLDITERKEAEKALLRAEEELEQRVEERTAQIRTLALDLTHAEQMERKRLAMALHDNLQQLLVGAKIGLEMAGRKAAGPDIKESLNSVAALLDESIGASRTLTLEMSPPILYEAGLVAGIHWLGRWMLEKYGLTVEIESDGEIAADTEGVCMLLFQ
ncbi:MAG: PAS domain S-box protein, partial [Rhodocyclaceae bacterium]|nr:PAS domain S-box protein [Rhodocyclaceae bacterium]